jgi:transposase-like protein
MCDLTNPAFTDEGKARKFLEASRWPDGPICAFCGQLDTVAKLGGKSMGRGWYYCSGCQDKFTVRIGTLMERSHIPMHKWLLASHLIVASKKGISALQLSRMLGITYKSSWFMCHRIREGMTPATCGPIGGEVKVVESDEAVSSVSRTAYLTKPRTLKQKARALFYTAISYSIFRGKVRPTASHYWNRQGAIGTDKEP